MRRFKGLLVVAMACALALAFATSAFAAGVAIDLPDAGYLSGTTKIDLPSQPEWAEVRSISNGQVLVAFGGDLLHTHTINSPFVWGVAPNVENPGLKGLLSTNYGEDVSAHPMSASMALSRPVAEFGFEMSPWWIPGPMDVTVTFTNTQSGQVVGTVTRKILGSSGNCGARLFAIRSDVLFDRIDVSASYPLAPGNYGFLMSQVRYALAPTNVTKPGLTPRQPEKCRWTSFNAWLSPEAAAAGGRAKLTLSHLETKTVRKLVRGHMRRVKIKYWRVHDSVLMSIDPANGRLSTRRKLPHEGSWRAQVSFTPAASSSYLSSTSQTREFTVE